MRSVGTILSTESTLNLNPTESTQLSKVCNVTWYMRVLEMSYLWKLLSMKCPIYVIWQSNVFNIGLCRIFGNALFNQLNVYVPLDLWEIIPNFSLSCSCFNCYNSVPVKELGMDKTLIFPDIRLFKKPDTRDHAWQ